jgi:hypothetical protein
MDELKRKVVEESGKVSIKVKEKIEDWEMLIISTIFKHFSQQPFCCYDVVKKILGDEIKDRRKFYKWAMRVRKVLGVLLNNNRIEFLGWEEGNAPINKKMYRVVRR